MRHYKFGSIEQFKNVIKHVRDYAKKHNTPIPTMKFRGSEKLHGSNAAMVYLNEGTTYFQSRERILTIESDNAGFYMWGERSKADLLKTVDEAKSLLMAETPELANLPIILFGEWCGGSIQKGVALNHLPKQFVIFNITVVSGKQYVEFTEDQIKSVVQRTDEIRCIYDFETWEIEIDFNRPQDFQNQLVEITLSVEEESPFAKRLGVVKAEGVSTIGEGVVWWHHGSNLKFKCKGEKHSSSHVSTVKQIAAVDLERMRNVAEFVDKIMSENRLNQGFDKLREMGLDIDVKNTSAYIRWCVGDAIKEENDVIIASNLDMKELNKGLSDKAKKYWFEKLNNEN